MPGLYLPGSKPFSYGSKTAPAPVPAGSPGATPSTGWKPPWKTPGVGGPLQTPPPSGGVPGQSFPSYTVGATSSGATTFPKTPAPMFVGTPARELARVVPALTSELVLCPEFGCQNSDTGPPGLTSSDGPPMQDIASVIVELNDRHGWSRERIADWLETLPYDLTIQPASEGN